MNARQLQRFIERIAIDTNCCWSWTDTKYPNGYAYFKTPRGTRYGHRLAYLHWTGPIAEGLEIDHLCRNRACVNPDHLEAVTHRENLLRGAGPIPRHARQTHCVNGHEFTVENTSRKSNGGRRCKTCNRLQASKHRENLEGN